MDNNLQLLLLPKLSNLNMKKPLIIGITGGSGSGKTSLINELRANFSNEQICLISQDNYYKPLELQKLDENGVVNFDLPKSIDKSAFLKDVKLLMGGEKVIQLEYTFNNRDAIPKEIVLNPAPIILVEGLFVFHYKKMMNLLDVKVFVHAKENLKVIRRITRDRVERNYPLDDVLYRYENHVLPTFEKYIEPYKERADIIINNNLNYKGGLLVLEGFLRDYLKNY